jgi:hypothetical protein
VPPAVTIYQYQRTPARDDGPRLTPQRFARAATCVAVRETLGPTPWMVARRWLGNHAVAGSDRCGSRDLAGKVRQARLREHCV